MNQIDKTDIHNNWSDSEFEQLFKSHYEDLCRFAYQYVYEKEIAEDLVQNVFLNIWKIRHKWHPKGTVKSYLYKAVHNQAKNHSQRKIIQKIWEEEVAHAPEQGVETPEKKFQREEIQKVYKNALDGLPKRCRLIFTLCKDNGLKYKEIAEMLNISIKTVETQMGRALKKLQKGLAKYYPLSK